MEIKLPEDERGWAIAHLEDIATLLEEVREWDKFDKWPIIGTDQEFIEHLTAIFKETQCAGCKQDFSK